MLLHLALRQEWTTGPRVQTPLLSEAPEEMVEATPGYLGLGNAKKL